MSRLCPVRTGRPRSFAREGVNLETSTLFGWVGATAAVLKPLLDTLAAEVMALAPRWSAASTCCDARRSTSASGCSQSSMSPGAGAANETMGYATASKAVASFAADVTDRVGLAERTIRKSIAAPGRSTKRSATGCGRSRKSPTADRRLELAVLQRSFRGAGSATEDGRFLTPNRPLRLAHGTGRVAPIPAVRGTVV